MGAVADALGSAEDVGAPFDRVRGPIFLTRKNTQIVSSNSSVPPRP